MHPAVRSLLNWYRTHARDLPWRRTEDAYAIFISELMLQQTQVDRVIPKYQAWLKRFPTWAVLAKARTSDIVQMWSGLGYNRRGLYAREAAIQIAQTGLPDTLEDWKHVKGVGPYMAAALLEFAQHKRAVVIDTNVRRVAGRVFLGIPFPKPVDDKRLIERLEDATPLRGNHWHMPQAFMDLANAICLNRSPKCAICPLRKDCKAAWYFLEGGKGPKREKKESRERIQPGKDHPDRIFRGRILKLVLEQKKIAFSRIGPLVDDGYRVQDHLWMRAMAERLVKDGLLAWSGKDILVLPK